MELTDSEAEILLGFVAELLDSQELPDYEREILGAIYEKLESRQD